MKTRIIIMSMLIAASSLTAQAQVRKRAAKTKAKTEMTEEQQRVQELYERMLPSTAQLLVIDSVVVDSADFISHIPLNKESGRISTYDKFWKTTGQAASGVYTNEFGNRVFYSKTDADGRAKLYMADKLGGEWSNQRLIDEFGDEFSDINYPFMMSDGTTLYFAAKGSDGLGGYDIYVTRYDTDSARFYQPENIGLPYNSTADDLYCIIDDFDELGWLVTSRRQPAGKVCIYTFVPSLARDVYDDEAVEEDKLNSLAKLNSIQDTWTDEGKLLAARKRLAALKERNSDVENSQIAFIVNDNTVYTSANDFKSPANRERFTKLCALKKNAEEMAEGLDTMRQKYSGGSSAVKRRLSADILKAEKQLEELSSYIHNLEKEIRNTENMAKADR